MGKRANFAGWPKASDACDLLCTASSANTRCSKWPGAACTVRAVHSRHGRNSGWECGLEGIPSFSRSHKVKTVTRGFDPGRAFCEMMGGANVGKAIVVLEDE